jgi:hypothetical protein
MEGKLRNRRLSRDEALEEYLVYRKRVRELLDMAQISKDIGDKRYRPQDLLGRGPERFRLAVANALMGLFASLLYPQSHALNVFDVWLALFPAKTARINQTWDAVRPHVQLIRDYRNDIACHANKNIRRHAETYLNHHRHFDEIVGAMQAVSQLAAELLRDEATALPNLRSEAEAILDKTLAPLLRDMGQSGKPVVFGSLKDYFLQREAEAGNGSSLQPAVPAGL